MLLYKSEHVSTRCLFSQLLLVHIVGLLSHRFLCLSSSVGPKCVFSVDLASILVQLCHRMAKLPPTFAETSKFCTILTYCLHTYLTHLCTPHENPVLHACVGRISNSQRLCDIYGVVTSIETRTTYESLARYQNAHKSTRIEHRTMECQQRA